ncbi:hypothetical protein OnM2_051061 [Erysiphe neolycopersici]|uniref:Uncharacterized protein n=1 Tax=Erysiphe neolycopersici TaxID=212602 RepID=A0A420HSL3_9PEZI|nr:hypothetical protein OnM2_051061 [Erysiphe neolycopersici]
MGLSYKISPYKSPQVKLTFGGKDEVYFVPRVFLKDQTWVTDEGGTYKSPDNEEVGHVLIHFLFTGEYQILEIDEKKLSETKTSAQLRIALKVLLSSQRWKLSRLQVLVQSEIESLSKSMHLFDIIRVVDEVIQENKKNIDKVKWLQDFLVESINKAMESSYKDFDNFSLLDKLQDKNIIRFLAKNLIRIYHSRPSKINEEDTKVRATELSETDSLSALTVTQATLSSGKREDCVKNEISVTLHDPLL